MNAEAKDGSALAELMRIYTNLDAYNYERFPNTSKRKADLKKSKEGVKMMCDIVEEYAEKQSKIAVRQTEEKLAGKLLREGMTIEKVVSMMEMLTIEDVEKISREQ
ncbi:hypothetical protein GCM10008910_32570 [Faecalicatena orotica]|uniref:Uncharacterized protein n=1 Tax=Faecalicatena orotica TaxID=1544 RepID=A0A2Y9BI77_9FIRM|nr:hypothetical protein [Faecalicatena orotica]PWJ23441.1 hypothetical protein A8806_11467 [Faecalicatena orotica]SSA57699.1 hypothetical protein SAMN05216536_11467 [Faecalicatena orotica]